MYNEIQLYIILERDCVINRRLEEEEKQKNKELKKAAATEKKEQKNRIKIETFG